MGNLIAKAPVTGQAAHGGLVLRPVDLGPVTSIAPFKGQAAAVAAALGGGGFPAPNRIVHRGKARIIWTGRDQAFLIGPRPSEIAQLAALTDQSDGWACLALTGPLAAECLMRLVPIDLHQMQKDDAVRAPLGHMQAVIWRQDQGFELLVFRSMVQTAWHEIETAMRSLAARA